MVDDTSDLHKVLVMLTLRVLTFDIIFVKLYHGPRVVKFIAAVLWVYQYLLGKKNLWAKNILGKKFFGQKTLIYDKKCM